MDFIVLLSYFFSAVIAYGVYMLVKIFNDLKIMNNIPGPKGIPFFGNISEVRKSPDVMFKAFEEYGKIYPIYKLYTCTFFVAIFLNTPEDVEVILSTTKYIEKSRMYNPFHIWLNTGLLTSSGDKWHTRRRILTPTFHFSILQQFSQTFIQKSEEFVNEIQGLVNKEMGIENIFNKYMFYTICETAMGTTFKISVEKYRKAVLKMGEITVHRVINPAYYAIPLYMTSSKFYERFFVARYLHKCSRNIIKKRKETFNTKDITVTKDNVYKSKNRLAMLDMLLFSKNIANNIDDEGIREEVDTFVFEGHDTTATSLSFTIMLLACNKDIQDEAAKEVAELLPEKEDRLTFEILSSLKYLERVIKESLRLYPSVPMFGRYISEPVKTHTGYVLAPRTDVMIRPYDMHRNPAIYPDPEKFDPDRFLPDNVQKRHPYAYIPFSAGPRNCIGQKFALLELKSFLASILRSFIILPVDTPETITLVTDLILHTKNGIRVKFIPRC